MSSSDQDRVNHFRQRWAEEHFSGNSHHVQSRPPSSTLNGDFAGVDEVVDPEPTSHQQDIRDNLRPKSKPSWRSSLRSNLFRRTPDKITESNALPQIPQARQSDEEEALPTVDGTKKPSKSKPESKLLTEIYTLSWLIFFSILGTLSRLGVEAITLYPNAPVTSRVLWANFGGSFIMGFFTEDRRLFKQPNPPPTTKEDNEKRRSSTSADAKASHNKFKKTIPLYIGLTVGYCGSFTSFSSFMRDAFLSLTNALDPPSPTSAYQSSTSTPRSGGFSFLALLSILILHPSISIISFQTGAQLALLLSPLLKPIPSKFLNKILNPLLIPLSLGIWLLLSLILSIIPPGDPINWRTRALLPMLFSPLGCIARYYLSKYLNPLAPKFPLGTFTANILATMVLGMCYDLQHASFTHMNSKEGVSPNACAVLVGVMEGFCGCLSTVSTWVGELTSLKRRDGWVYGAASVGVGLAVLVCIMGGMGWTVGFAEPRCG